MRRRVVSAWRRLLREEEGVALVLAIISMLVLTIALTTVMFMTAAGARDAHRSNAGQKASALAESGINNALAVLNANYPGVTIYPGDSTLLPTRTTTYPTGSVTWSGTLVNVPTNPAGWKWQWELTALGNVKNPTGPTAGDVVRRATAVVPVVIPDSTSVPPGTTATDWIYGLNDVTFGQSVDRRCAGLRRSRHHPREHRRRSPRRSRRRSPSPRVRTGSRPGTTCRS